MGDPNVKDAAAFLQTKQPYIDAPNGLKYSLIGYIIETINTTFSDKDFDTGLKLLQRAVAEGCDLHAPCWVNHEQNKFYPPLEYMCVLHKVRLRCDDMVQIARSMVAAGAKLHPELFVTPGALEHAHTILF